MIRVEDLKVRMLPYKEKYDYILDHFKHQGRRIELYGIMVDIADDLSKKYEDYQYYIMFHVIAHSTFPDDMDPEKIKFDYPEEDSIVKTEINYGVKNKNPQLTETKEFRIWEIYKRLIILAKNN
jgi:hypothetical protein